MKLTGKQTVIRALLDAYIHYSLYSTDKHYGRYDSLCNLFGALFGFSPGLMLSDCYQEYRYESNNLPEFNYDNWLDVTSFREARKLRK